MHLVCAKTFLCRPSSQTQTFGYRSIKQNKRFVTGSGNKTLTFGNQQTLPPVRHFFMFGTMSFKLWEPAVPNNDSCLPSKT